MTSPTDPVAAVAALVGCDVVTDQIDTLVSSLHTVKQLRGWLDAYEAGVTQRISHEHQRGSGAPAADLHARHQGCSAREARAKERRGKTLDEAPSFGEALAAGRIGAEHADALGNITAGLDDQLKGELLSHESELLDEARRSSPEQFARQCRARLDRIKRQHGVDREQRQRQETRLRRSTDNNGMHRFNGEFHNELGTAITSAIDAEIAAIAKAGRHDGLDRQQLAAIALGNLVAGGHQATRPTVAQVVAITDLTTLTDGLHEHSINETLDGAALSPEAIRRLCCDAEIIPVVLGGNGVPLDVGRARRLATREQRFALRAMYRTCAFDGCDVAFSRCEIHHLIEWEQLGDTDLHNLLPLCSRHHHVVHEGGWGLELDTDRTLTITLPDGTIYAIVPIQMSTTQGTTDPPGQPPPGARVEPAEPARSAERVEPPRPPYPGSDRPGPVTDPPTRLDTKRRPPPIEMSQQLDFESLAG